PMVAMWAHWSGHLNCIRCRIPEAQRVVSRLTTSSGGCSFCRLSLVRWLQQHDEPGATSRRVLDLDHASVRGRKLGADEKPESQTRHRPLGRLPPPVEGGEELRALGLRDALALIRYGDLQV